MPAASSASRWLEAGATRSPDPDRRSNVFTPGQVHSADRDRSGGWWTVPHWTGDARRPRAVGCGLSSTDHRNDRARPRPLRGAWEFARPNRRVRRRSSWTLTRPEAGWTPLRGLPMPLGPPRSRYTRSSTQGPTRRVR